MRAKMYCWLKRFDFFFFLRTQREGNNKKNRNQIISDFDFPLMFRLAFVDWVDNLIIADVCFVLFCLEKKKAFISIVSSVSSEPSSKLSFSLVLLLSFYFPDNWSTVSFYLEFSQCFFTFAVVSFCAYEIV